MFLTDYLGDEPENWEAGDWIFLKTPPGSGKTTFAQKFAIEKAREGKRVLFLSPRTILTEQMMSDHLCLIARTEEGMKSSLKNIHFFTYQALEQRIKCRISVPEYDVVIADEAHYFLSDAAYNEATVISFNWLTAQRDSLILFMSGTIDKFRTYIEENFQTQDPPQESAGKMRVTTSRHRICYEYEMEADYTCYDVAYISDFDEIAEILARSKGEKSVVFVSSKNRGERLEEKLRKHSIAAVFVNAQNKNTITQKTVSNLVNVGCFREDVLIATSVLDVGVSIHDAAVGQIFIDTYDEVSFKQMLARVRIRGDEHRIKLFISQQGITGFRERCEQLQDKIHMYKTLVDVTEENLPRKIAKLSLQEGFSPDAFNPVLTQYPHIRLNHLAGAQFMFLYAEYVEIMKGLTDDPDFFLLRQLKWLGKEDEFDPDNFVSKEIEETRRKAFSELIEKKLPETENGIEFKQIQKVLKELKEAARLLDRKRVRSNENLSVKNFNEVCKLYDLPFQIIQEEVARRQIYRIKKFADSGSVR